MSRTTKGWLIAATVLVVFGSLLFAAAMTVNQWDFMKLSTVAYETNTYELSESFHDIEINTDTADISFVLSGDDKCSVICRESEQEKHMVEAENGVLTIRTCIDKNVFDSIGIVTESPEITIYLPKREYASLILKGSTGDIEISRDFLFRNMDVSTSTGDVENKASSLDTMKIRTNTGDIHVADVFAGELDLTVSTGEVTGEAISCSGDTTITVDTGKTQLTDVTCQNLISNGNTGDLFLQSVIAQGSFSIERSTGDVNFERCDAADIFVKTSTGYVEGSLLSEKLFITETSTGRVVHPQSGAGGNCTILTRTGDIKIRVETYHTN